MSTDDDGSVTKDTNYKFDIFNVVDYNLYCISFTSFITVPEDLTVKIRRRTSVIE